ncbi:transposase [Cellulosimicrobium cellulans]|nr:transposase [Cellulosimicrobium cellulans]
MDSTINRAHQHAATLPRATGGVGESQESGLLEPADHALGRSRGGLSTKIHAAVDGDGRPLAVLVGPGQGGDAPMCLPLLDAIRVPRAGAGRPRTTPDAVLGDRAYSSRAIRTELRRRGIAAVIPEPRDQQAHRRRRGSRGGRPVTYDPVAYRGRNTVERFLPHQAMERARDPLRQARRDLPRRGSPGRDPDLARPIVSRHGEPVVGRARRTP